MRRILVTLCLTTAAAAALAGCGGGSDGTSSSPGPHSSAPASSPASPSESSSASASGTDLPANCTPPTENVKYKSGTATLDVTAGPDKGQYALSLDRTEDNTFAKSDLEITGSWISANKQAFLSIDIEGSDPCQPDAFTTIATEGKNGPVFIDPSHTQCQVAMTSLGEAGAQGTFTCVGLVGGGEGLERDASGTFTLLP